MDSGTTTPATPVDALAGLVASFDHLLEAVEAGGLEGFDDPGLVGFLTRFEQLRNRLPLIDHAAIADGERRGLPEALVHKTMCQVLSAVLRLSPAEAAARVRAAKAVGNPTSMLGEPLEPRRPVLAAAQRAGQVTPEQVDLITRALAGVDRRGFDPGEIAAGERLLTEFAHTVGPKDLRHLAEKTIDAIDPDGTLPRDEVNADRRFFRIRPTRDGAYAGEFRLTGAVGAKLNALLGPLAKPRTDTDLTGQAGPASEESEAGRTDGAGSGRRSTFALDERSHGQRMHDALETACDRLLRADGLPDSGGTPASVIVTITLEDLLDRLGYGTTTDGTLLSAREVLNLAGQAEVIPALLTRGGRILDLGRTRRIASASQTYALIARDLGCSFPGCAAPPEWSERHHIVGWAEGGTTRVDNLTLLCAYHHHNFLNRGWAVALNRDGLLEWTPPRWIDPDQKALINTRILLQRVIAQRRRALTAQSHPWDQVARSGLADELSHALTKPAA